MARRAYRTGLTPAAITDAAVALTAERGLDGWTMRDLTARLDTSLSVIYHHIGDRERVCAAVVDKVYADMRLPLDDTDWRTLLHRVLTAMIDQLADYPGVAAWLLRNGPQTERLVPVLDAGVSRMLDAGWGEEAATAYSIAFNTCLGLIALDDQRARDPDGGGLTGLHRLLETHPEAGPGAERMRRMVAEFAAADDAERVRVRREYGRYALERLLDGLELRLHALRASAGMDQPPGDDQR